MFKNKLIVFEGVDGAGKSCMAKKLASYLNDRDIPTVLTQQPGDIAYGTHASIFRSMCIDKRWKLHPLTNFFIFFADKVEQAYNVIIPALEAGATVISDRWWYSTFAYQFVAKQLVKKYAIDEKTGLWLNMNSVLGLKPNMVFYFDTPLESTNDEFDQFETADVEFKKRVKEGYDSLYELNSYASPWYKVAPIIGEDKMFEHMISLVTDTR